MGSSASLTCLSSPIHVRHNPFGWRRTFPRDVRAVVVRCADGAGQDGGSVPPACWGCCCKLARGASLSRAREREKDPPPQEAVSPPSSSSTPSISSSSSSSSCPSSPFASSSCSSCSIQQHLVEQLVDLLDNQPLAIWSDSALSLALSLARIVPLANGRPGRNERFMSSRSNKVEGTRYDWVIAGPNFV
jgi:hypothetical protein